MPLEVARSAGQIGRPIGVDFDLFNSKPLACDQRHAVSRQRGGQRPPRRAVRGYAAQNDDRPAQRSQPCDQLVAGRRGINARIDQQFSGRRPGIAGHIANPHAGRPDAIQRQCRDDLSLAAHNDCADVRLAERNARSTGPRVVPGSWEAWLGCVATTRSTRARRRAARRLNRETPTRIGSRRFPCLPITCRLKMAFFQELFRSGPAHGPLHSASDRYNRHDWSQRRLLRSCQAGGAAVSGEKFRSAATTQSGASAQRQEIANFVPLAALARSITAKARMHDSLALSDRQRACTSRELVLSRPLLPDAWPPIVTWPSHRNRTACPGRAGRAAAVTTGWGQLGLEVSGMRNVPRSSYSLGVATTSAMTPFS